MRLALPVAAAVFALAATSAAACGPAAAPPMRPLPPISAGKVRVRVFTEPAAVRALAAVGASVLVATDNGLERWEDARATTVPELEGTRVSALAPDPEASAAWLLAETVVGRYDLAAATYAELPPPPPELAPPPHDPGTVLAAAGDGGVWLGSARGLVYASPGSGWSATSIKDPVRALVRDRAGWLWIATATGLVARKPTGDFIKLGAAQGCALVDARLLVTAPGDRVVAIGADDAGHERLAIGAALAFTSYRTLPDIRWDAATRRGAGVIVTSGDHAYRIAPADGAGAIRPLARDGTRLVALPPPLPPLGLPGAAPPPPADDAPSPSPPPPPVTTWAIDPVDVVLPPSATVLGAADDQLLVGTRDLGVARYRDGDRHARDWLRARAMFADATTLSVACAHEQDCWIATGARAAWHWTGEHFTALARPDRVVLAVIRDPAGPIYAIERDSDDLTALRIARLDGVGLPHAGSAVEGRRGAIDSTTATWTTLRPAATTESGIAELAFVRFAAPGILWLGLRGHAGDDTAAPAAASISVVELASGKVTPMADAPAAVSDADVRGPTAWFTTAAGVARISGGRLTTWTERDGLRSELARAVSISPTGDAVVGTRAGAGVWDGKAWTFPPALRFEVNDLVATRSGLWLASERGLVAWDGKNLRRFDTLRGLAENEVLDVAADHYGRIWARGPTSLTLITQ